MSDGVENARVDWLPAGEEPHPAGNITHYSVQRFDGISALSVHNGDIDSVRDPATGVYRRDTRYLSRLCFTFGGVAPILLDSRQPDTMLSVVFTNPAIRKPSGKTIAAQSLVVRRRRVVGRTLLESLNVSNYGRQEVTVELRVEFAADFADIFEVRGYARTSAPPTVEQQVSEREVVYSCKGSDGTVRQTTIRLSQRPAQLTAREAVFRLPLTPRESRDISIEVCPDREPTGEPVAVAAGRVRTGQQDWISASTRIVTNHDAINEMLERSLIDVQSLRTHTDEDEYLAAGVPWFDTLFGRDSLIAGIELVAFAPEILKLALIVLAKYQANETDPVHDATPGKIPHELRWGELASAGEVPFGRYYGSVDSTPLFIVAAWHYVRWTQDYATLRRIWPNLCRALEWCRAAIKGGVRGFVSYSRISTGGLENQGWKDSHNAIVWPDGDLVDQPIALVEVQAYVAEALGAYANMAAMLGDASAAEVAREAARFAAAIDEAFAHEALGYVLCLDGFGKPVPTPASNAGHALWCGVARRDLAAATARRLMAPDLFSGWGVRTLSSTIPGYNPLGYHVGAVWPHDNALFLAGLRWYGFDDLAERLGTALIEMALAFPAYRVPELFSGDPRELRHVPTPYPVASRPQAWSAAAMPSVFTSMLGLHPGRPGQITVTRPMLPDGIDFLRVCNLHYGGETVDLAFRRQDRRVSVEVERVPSGVEVVLSQVFPEDLPSTRETSR